MTTYKTKSAFNGRPGFPKGNKFHLATTSHVGRANLVVQTMQLPNVFNDWLEAENVNIKDLAIATGIRPYRLKELATGMTMPHLPEAIAIEKATGGAFTTSDWASVPLVALAVTRYEGNAGKPMAKWVEGQWRFDGVFLRPRVRAAMADLWKAWLLLPLEDRAAFTAEPPVTKRSAAQQLPPVDSGSGSEGAAEETDSGDAK